MSKGIDVSGGMTVRMMAWSVLTTCAIGCASSGSPSGTAGNKLGPDSSVAGSGGASGGSSGGATSGTGGATGATGGATTSGSSGSGGNNGSTNAEGGTERDAGADAALDAGDRHCGTEICGPGEYCYGYTPAGIGGSPGQPYETCKSDLTGCATSCAQCNPGGGCSCDDQHPLVYVSCRGL
jgi:hypothetical protein